MLVSLRTPSVLSLHLEQVQVHAESMAPRGVSTPRPGTAVTPVPCVWSEGTPVVGPWDSALMGHRGHQYEQAAEDTRVSWCPLCSRAAPPSHWTSLTKRRVKGKTVKTLAKVTAERGRCGGAGRPPVGDRQRLRPAAAVGRRSAVLVRLENTVPGAPQAGSAPSERFLRTPACLVCGAVHWPETTPRGPRLWWVQECVSGRPAGSPGLRAPPGGGRAQPPSAPGFLGTRLGHRQARPGLPSLPWTGLRSGKQALFQGRKLVGVCSSPPRSPAVALRMPLLLPLQTFSCTPGVLAHGLFGVTYDLLELLSSNRPPPPSPLLPGSRVVPPFSTHSCPPGIPRLSPSSPSPHSRRPAV